MDRKAPVARRVARRAEFDTGFMLTRTLSTWFGSVLVFLPLTILLFAPALALHHWNVESALSPREQPYTTAETYTRVGATLFVQILCGSLATAGFCYAVVKRQHGERVGIGEALRRGLSRLPSAFVISLIVTLAVAGALVPSVLLVGQGAGIPAFIVGIIFVLWILVVWSLAIPATVIEQLGPGSSLARSMSLTKGSRLAIFASWLLIGLLVWLAVKPLSMALFSLSDSALSEAAEESGHDAVLSKVRLRLWLETGFNLLAYSLQAVSVGVAYFGLRRAREGALPDELLKAFE